MRDKLSTVEVKNAQYPAENLGELFMEIVDLPITLRDLSHELRTPLVGILGSAELLEHDEPLTAKQREYIGYIRKSGNALLELANRLLLEAKKIN